VTTVTTPTAWSKLGEAVFFLDRLRREHATAAPSANVFGFYLSAFLNAAYSLIEILEFEVKVARINGYDEWFRAFAQGLPDAGRSLWVFMRRQRRLEVHFPEGMEIRSDERQAIPSADHPVGGVTHPQAFYRILATWYPGQMDPDPLRRTRDEAPLHHFEIEGDRREVVQVCAAYVGLLRLLLDEFHASPLARGGP
jgi:hypothetical protein